MTVLTTGRGSHGKGLCWAWGQGPVQHLWSEHLAREGSWVLPGHRAWCGSRGKGGSSEPQRGDKRYFPLGALGSPAVCGAPWAQAPGPSPAPFHPHSIKCLAGTSYTPWGQGSYRSCPGFPPTAPSITLTFPHWFCIRNELPGGESERLHFFFTPDRNCSGSSSPRHTRRRQGRRLGSKGHAVLFLACSALSVSTWRRSRPPPFAHQHSGWQRPRLCQHSHRLGALPESHTSPRRLRADGESDIFILQVSLPLNGS